MVVALRTACGAAAGKDGLGPGIIKNAHPMPTEKPDGQERDLRHCSHRPHIYPKMTDKVAVHRIVPHMLPEQRNGRAVKCRVVMFAQGEHRWLQRLYGCWARHGGPKLPNFGPMPRIILILSLMALIGAVGCIPRPDYPDQPVVEFVDQTLTPDPGPFDSVAVLQFRFTDGDGDFGLDEGDTLGDFAPGSIYYYNVLVFYRELKDGVYVQRPDTTAVKPHARIRRLTGNDGDGPLEGDLYIAARAFPAAGVDSIRYAVCLVDRALHVSDTVVTPAIAYPY
jgi:hypothetical protein